MRRHLTKISMLVAVGFAGLLLALALAGCGSSYGGGGGGNSKPANTTTTGGGGY